MSTLTAVAPPLARATRPGLSVDQVVAPALIVVATACYATNVLELISFYVTGERLKWVERLLNMGLYALILAIAIRRAPVMLRNLTAAPAILVMLTIPVLSLAWSVDQAETAQRLFAFMCSSLVGLYVGATMSLRKGLTLFALGFALAAALNLGAVLAFADARGTVVWPDQWRGFNFQKNALGRNSAIGALLCAFVALQTRGQMRLLMLAAVALNLLLLMKTGSRTSQFVLIFALALGSAGLLLRRAAALWLMAAVLASVTVAATVWVLFANGVAAQILEHFGRDATLTGRVQIWAVLGTFLDQRPWLGWGYAAFWDPSSARLMFFERTIYQTPVYGHSGYMDTLASVGRIGLASVAVVALIYVRDAVVVILRWPHERAVVPLAVFLILMLAINVMESKLMERNEILWIMFLSFAVSLSLMRRAAAGGGAGPGAAPRRGGPGPD